MYDIFFISYDEPNAETNWNILKFRFPMAHRIHGVKGIHEAHKAAAKKSFTTMFFVVDGDAKILDTFDFNYRVRDDQYDTVHVWKSKNPINDLEYGYGAVKLLPKIDVSNMQVGTVDMTTSIARRFLVVDQISNVTEFNTDPFNTWKSAFRECCKLASKAIKGQINTETETRLDVWCNKGIDRPFGEYAIRGAIEGRKFGEDNKDNPEVLSKINDFDWLRQRYGI